MLGKRSRPATIGMRTGPASSAELVDSSTSPRSPLDCRILSPRSPKNYDQQGGVGLGIVVALNNNNDTNSLGGEILAKYALCSQFSCRSIPIPMNNNNNNNNNNNSSTIDNDEYEELDDMFDEEFTYVTCHGPNKTMTTRVYYNGADYGRVMGRGISSNLGVFTISSPGTTTTTTTQDRGYKSDSDFLSSCHLCRKTLHGKDIFMYRGEKAFCSTECRQSQICIEERKEKCSTSANVYGSIRDGHILSPGIMAR